MYVLDLDRLVLAQRGRQPARVHPLGGQPPPVGAIDEAALLEEGVDGAPQGRQRARAESEASLELRGGRLELPRGDRLTAEMVDQLLRLRGELGGVRGDAEGADGVLAGELAEGHAHEERVRRGPTRRARGIAPLDQLGQGADATKVDEVVLARLLEEPLLHAIRVWDDDEPARHQHVIYPGTDTQGLTEPRR